MRRDCPGRSCARSLLAGVVLTALVASACGSSGPVAASTGSSGPPPAISGSSPEPRATGPAGGSGSTGASTVSDPASEVPDACSLISPDDASVALGADVEVVKEPFAAGIIQGDPAEFASACAYRPVGTDREQAIAIGIAAPGSITPEEFDELTEGGIALGGPGDEGYAIEGGVLFRRGDLIVGIVVDTGEGLATDRALALELAGIAAAGLPAPAPDPSNPSCALLTEPIAEASLGLDLVFGSDALVDEQRSGCGYRDANGPAFVSLRVTRGTDAATDFEAALGAASGAEGFRELDGIGDRAFVRTGGGAIDVVVLAGDAFLATTTFSPEGDLTEETIALATAIVGSL